MYVIIFIRVHIKFTIMAYLIRPPATQAITMARIIMKVWYFTWALPHFVCMIPKYIRTPAIRHMKLVITPLQFKKITSCKLRSDGSEQSVA